MSNSTTSTTSKPSRFVLLFLFACAAVGMYTLHNWISLSIPDFALPVPEFDESVRTVIEKVRFEVSVEYTKQFLSEDKKVLVVTNESREWGIRDREERMGGEWVNGGVDEGDGGVQVFRNGGRRRNELFMRPSRNEDTENEGNSKDKRPRSFEFSKTNSSVEVKNQNSLVTLLSTPPTSLLYRTPPVKLAFILFAHNNGTLQGLREFLEVGYHPHHVYFIHVDAKVSEPEYLAFQQQLQSYPNIRFSKFRYFVLWGFPSIIEMEMHLLKLAHEYNLSAEAQKSGKWSHVMNLCGYSYPLQPLWRLEYLVGSLNGKSMVSHRNDMVKGCTWSDTVKSSRGEPVEENCRRTVGRCMDEECSKMWFTPRNGVILKNTQWVLLASQYVDYLITSPLAQEWYQFFLKTRIPDESFFQTVLYNSPFNDTQYIYTPPTNPSTGSSLQIVNNTATNLAYMWYVLLNFNY
ncbi:core-2/I-branching enzyme-domain-containing protein [Paraphysoderma sedebokerense]|nr:core-2/I-branching enzyme-domain-containing protein [Paraphysoderma sedebokerense]